MADGPYSTWLSRVAVVAASMTILHVCSSTVCRFPPVKFLNNVQCKVDPGRQSSGSKENIVALDEPAAPLQLNLWKLLREGVPEFVVRCCLLALQQSSVGEFERTGANGNI